MLILQICIEVMIVYVLCPCTYRRVYVHMRGCMYCVRVHIAVCVYCVCVLCVCTVCVYCVCVRRRVCVYASLYVLCAFTYRSVCVYAYECVCMSGYDFSCEYNPDPELVNICTTKTITTVRFSHLILTGRQDTGVEMAGLRMLKLIV